VRIDVEGQAFALGAAAELTVYRIIQESLTNTLKHASATGAHITIRYDRPVVTVKVEDDGTGGAGVNGGNGATVEVGWPALSCASEGHGIGGMGERTALHRGSLVAGPAADGGWAVTATLRFETAAAATA
jgi:signal transduction histidine kinase